MTQTRKLAAILAADVVGYSRLMGEDEAGTARAVREHREAATPIVQEHGGRLVKTTGDGVLLEFPSVVAAVECSIAIQKQMVERNAGVPEEKRILYRIGVNLGDVLIDGEDILGDGVNIAARLESIAEPGGVCVSGSAYDQVRGRIEADFTDLGEKALKNIARPVRVYALKTGPAGPALGPLASTAEKSGPPHLSIVVLPFANLGGDPEQDYFVDGVTESLTTDLSRISGSFVIGRNTAYSYKGKHVDLKQIGRELFTTPPKVVAELLRANADLPDNPKTAVALVRQAMATRSKRSRRITIRTGWHDTSFVYPGETFGPLAGNLKHGGTSAIDPALGLKRGSLRDWREGLANAFRHSDYLIFAASVAFSGPLFDLAGEQEGVVFHFQPQNSASENKESKTKSSSGKTLAARVAISPIGRPKKIDLISFAVTERGLEDYCYSHSNLIGALDEEGRALSGTGKHIKPSQLPYQLTSGRGTFRSQKAVRDPDLQNLTWLLPFISTGEKPLDDPKNESARMEGAQVRMAPIPVPPGADGGIFNRLDGSREAIIGKAHLLVREIEDTLAENYGVVMPAHLRKLVPQRSSLARRVRRIMDKFVEKVGADSDPWERRFAEKFGIVLAGAIFASEFGLAPWTKERAWSAVRAIYRRSRAALASVGGTADALVGKLRKALTTDRFPRLDKGQTMKPEDAGRAWGITRKSATHGPALHITLAKLQGLIRPRAISSAVLAEFLKRGILIQSPEGKSTRETMIRGLNGSERRRYVVLKLSALLEAS